MGAMGAVGASCRGSSMGPVPGGPVYDGASPGSTKGLGGSPSKPACPGGPVYSGANPGSAKYPRLVLNPGGVPGGLITIFFTYGFCENPLIVLRIFWKRAFSDLRLTERSTLLSMS